MGQKNNSISVFNKSASSTNASGTIMKSLTGTELTRSESVFLRRNDLTSAQIAGLSNSLKP